MTTGRNSDVISLRIEIEFPAEAPRIYSIISDEHQWPETLEPRILKRAPHSRLTAALPDFSRPEFTIEATAEGTRVTLLHDLLKTNEDKKAYRKIWNAWFKTISKRVTQ